MFADIKKHVFISINVLKRLFKFQGDGYSNGLLQQIIETFGVVKKASDTAFDALKVVQGGSADTISINAGVAVVEDSNGKMQLITHPAEIDKFTITNDSVNYYVVLSYNTTKIEEGTVDISAGGVLTGTGTIFTEVLRSLPDFPTKVIFPNSATNNQEYIVSQVTSDTSVALNAVGMTAELAQAYVVLEAQTPGQNLSQADRSIYNRPSYTIELRTSDVLVANQEIILGTVVYSGGATVSITDRRSENILTQVDVETQSVSTNSNVLVGVEQVQYDVENGDKSMNRARVGWGVEVSDVAYTPNSASNLIQIADASTSAFGGIWATSSTFASGDLDGWRCYFEDGTYLIVATSIKNGTYGIDLTFADYPDTFPTTGILNIVPDADGIEVTAEPSDYATLGNPRFTSWFSIEDRAGVMRLTAGKTFAMSYRLSKRNFVSPQYTVNTTAGAYINETSFNADGTFNVASSTVMTSGALTTLLHSNNHQAKKAWLNQNNIFTGGVNSETTGTVATFGTNAVTLAGDANYYNITLAAADDVYWMSDIGEVGCRITLNVTASGGPSGTMDIYNNQGTAPSGFLKFMSMTDSLILSYASYSRSNTIELIKVDVGGTNYWRVLSVFEETNPSAGIATNLATLTSYASAWTDHSIAAIDVAVLTGTGTVTLNSGALRYHSIGSSTFASADLDLTISGGTVESFTIANMPVTGTVNDMNMAECLFRSFSVDLERLYTSKINGTTVTFTSRDSTNFLQTGSNWILKTLFTYENNL
jgi:hypothetical protein